MQNDGEVISFLKQNLLCVVSQYGITNCHVSVSWMGLQGFRQPAVLAITASFEYTHPFCPPFFFNDFF